MYTLVAQPYHCRHSEDAFKVASFEKRHQAEKYLKDRWPDADKEKDDEGVFWTMLVGDKLYEMYITSRWHQN